jgi:TadE-like protein
MSIGARRGTALLEFAGSLLVVSAAFSGMFQLGYSAYSYNRLVNAVRDGARYASLQPYGSSSVDPEFSKAVQRLVVYGDPKPGPAAKPVVPGLTEQNVELIIGDRTMTVTIRNFQIDGMFSKMKVDGRPTVTFPCTNGAGE